LRVESKSVLGGRKLFFEIDDFLDLNQEPTINLREVENLLDGIRVCRTLGLLDRFDIFIPEPIPSPMAQLKLQGKQRRRASGAKISKSPVKKWKWRDHS
jgi:hypothetical protein